MKALAFIIAATIFEAVGDAIMRIALHYHVLPGRIILFASATLLLALYGAFLNLAPLDFATATGVYLASLFITDWMLTDRVGLEKPSSRGRMKA